MAKYRKKPVVIEATQWLKLGDHPMVEEIRSRSEQIPKCKECGGALNDHGWVATREGGHIACPGDWIITGVQHEHYPCKPEIFAATYEPA